MRGYSLFLFGGAKCEVRFIPESGPMDFNFFCGKKKFLTGGLFKLNRTSHFALLFKQQHHPPHLK
jgi:hypothetical protein